MKVTAINNFLVGKLSLRNTLRWIFLAYVFIAASIGTLVILYPFLWIYHNATAPAPMPVILPNGFRFEIDWKSKHHKLHIADRNGNRVVEPDVRKIAWHGEAVYGYRTGHAKEVYYFVCDYDKDCSISQHLNIMEFNRTLKDRGYREIGPDTMKSYHELLELQDKKYPELEIINGRMVVPD
jgi:hypothetical protein